MGDVVFVLSRMCSCCARYWEGVCLAARAQCSSSLCSSGRLAWKRSVGQLYAGCGQAFPAQRDNTQSPESPLRILQLPVC